MPLRIYLLIFVLFFFSSCATIFNKRTYHVRVDSYAKFTKIEYKDTTYSLPADLQLTRSSKPIQMIAKRRGFQQEITIKPRPHARFLYGNMLFLYFAPIGYAIDFTNPKRFDYGRVILLDNVDTNRVLRLGISKRMYTYFARKYPYKKGEVYGSVYLPIVNYICLQPEKNHMVEQTGFAGIGAELEYVYHDNRSFGLSFSDRESFFRPLPGPAPDKFGADTSSVYSAINIELSHNHKLKRLLWGYGLHFTTMHMRTDYNDGIKNFSSEKRQWNSIGPVVKAAFQVGRLWYLGVRYSPSVYRFGAQQGFQYQHILGFDLNMHLRLKKKK